MSDFSSPPTKDLNFYKKPKKHGRDWIKVEPPATMRGISIVDTHAHINMLNDPALSLAQAEANSISFIEAMTDPLSVEGVGFYDELPSILKEALDYKNEFVGAADKELKLRLRLSCGVHPHYSKNYTKDTEAVLIEKLKDERTSALGEVGLDYHYDFSPRGDQIDVFERQIEIAKRAHLPLILHVREAFDDAFAAMKNAGWNEAGVLLHCYTSDEKEIKRWVDADCYVAFGGAFTFKKSAEIRAASKLVPLNRLLTETDAPFMSPEPFRSSECVPAHTIFTADSLFEFLSADSALDRGSFFSQVSKNALELLDREPTAWQRGEE